MPVFIVNGIWSLYKNILKELIRDTSLMTRVEIIWQQYGALPRNNIDEQFPPYGLEIEGLSDGQSNRQT